MDPFLKTIACALLVFPAAARAYVEPRDPINNWFSDLGEPLSAAQRAAARDGLPPFVKGMSFLIESNMDVPGCVTIQLVVRADGLTDKFLILDSVPKGRFDQAVLDSIKFWQFEARPGPTPTIFPINIDIPPSTRRGTRLPKTRPRECVIPQIKVHSTLPMGEPTAAPWPFYPPAEAEKRSQGCVTLGFTVRADGLADEYEVVDIKPDKRFLNTAMYALNEWKFAPRTPAPKERGYVTFSFLIQETGEPAPQCKAAPSQGSVKS
jgi:TonB family protein